MPSRPDPAPKPESKGGGRAASGASGKAAAGAAGKAAAGAPGGATGSVAGGASGAAAAVSGVPAGPRKLPKGGPSKAEQKKYRLALEALRSGSVRSSKGLAKEALKASGQDFSVDHMADHGTDNFEQDFTLGLLEGKTEMVREIDAAIDKIDGKGDLPYGVCESCADLPEERWARGCESCPWIPKGRLDVMPHARFCIKRQEELENRG